MLSLNLDCLRSLLPSLKKLVKTQGAILDFCHLTIFFNIVIFRQFARVIGEFQREKKLVNTLMPRIDYFSTDEMTSDFLQENLKESKCKRNMIFPSMDDGIRMRVSNPRFPRRKYLHEGFGNAKKEVGN